MQSFENRSHTSLRITAVSKQVKPKFSLAEQAEPSVAWLTGSTGICLLGVGHGIKTLKDTVKGHMARCTGKLAVPRRMEAGQCGHRAAWAQPSQAAGDVIPIACWAGPHALPGRCSQSGAGPATHSWPLLPPISFPWASIFFLHIPNLDQGTSALMGSPEVLLKIIKITVQLTVLAAVQQIGSSGSNQLSLH